MLNVMIFQGGAPDKLIYGAEESNSYYYLLIDQSVQEKILNEIFWEDKYSDYYKVIASENQYDLIEKITNVNMYNSDERNKLFEKYKFIAPIMRSCLFKNNLANVSSEYCVPTVIMSGENLNSSKPDELADKIIKPVRGSGCRGIVICIDAQTDRDLELKDKFRCIPNAIIYDTYTISQYHFDEKSIYAVQQLNCDLLTTKQLNVDFIVYDGTLWDYSITEKNQNELFSRWVTGTINHLPKITELVKKTIFELIKSLGIKRALMNFEAFITVNGEEINLKIFEINCRYSSTVAIPKGLSQNSSNMLEMTLDLFTRGNSNYTPFKEIVKGTKFEYKIGEVYYETSKLRIQN